MTGKKVDISKAESVYLNMITDEEAREIIHKGWSLSFVYSFHITSYEEFINKPFLS